MAELGGGVDGQLGPVAAAGQVGVRPVLHQDLHAALVALLGRQHQRRGQVCRLGVDVGPYRNPENSQSTRVQSAPSPGPPPLQTTPDSETLHSLLLEYTLYHSYKYSLYRLFGLPFVFI